MIFRKSLAKSLGAAQGWAMVRFARSVEVPGRGSCRVRFCRSAPVVRRPELYPNGCRFGLCEILRGSVPLLDRYYQGQASQDGAIPASSWFIMYKFGRVLCVSAITLLLRYIA